MEIRERVEGWIKKRPSSYDKTIVVLAPLFPWSPAVLTSKFKLKICVSSLSRLSSLAMEYYSRFENVKVELIDSLSDVWDWLEKAESIIDEGWKYSQPEVKRLLRTARTKIIVRLGSGFNVSVRTRGEGDGIRKMEIRHSDVGGVTNLLSSVFVWNGSSAAGLALESPGMIPARDLRSLLKCGIDGERTSKPTFLPVEAVDRVVEIRPGEVSAASLFPLEGNQRLPKVRTRLGAKLWVSRELVPSELFALKDLPEPLFLLVRSSKEVEFITRSLFDSCRIPLKSLSILLAQCLVVAETSQKPKLGNGRNIVRTEELKPEESLSDSRFRTEESECETAEELAVCLIQVRKSYIIISRIAFNPIQQVSFSTFFPSK